MRLVVDRSIAVLPTIKTQVSGNEGRVPAGNGSGSLLREETADARGCPRGDAATKEVGVFRPDRTTKRQSCGENRPVVRVARRQPLSSLSFEVGVNVASS